MLGERFILNCPACGKVEGYMPPETEEMGGATEDPEAIIVEEVVATSGGITSRVRCPRCGRWTEPSRVSPS